MYEYSAWLVAHMDGDTIHAGIDCGLDIATLQTIRFYGINAPELSTPEGKLAAQFVVDWFTANCPGGKFLLRTIKNKREKYGRYLGIILSPDGSKNLNDDLVASGHAVTYFPKLAP
jgi:endonuclease YncB( thermonuclease family)